MGLEKRDELRLLALIILLGLGLRLAGSLLFPIWSGPEEGAHFFYAEFIGQNNALPTIKLSVETLASIYNESIHQPPLFYLAMAPFYKLASAQETDFTVHFLRLFSAILGTACIPLTYLIAKKLSFGKNVRIGSAVFIALLPTHVIASSTFSNSPMNWVFCLGAVYFSIAAMQGKKLVDLILAGLLVAAATLTMFTGMSVAIAFAAAWLVVLFKGKQRLWKRLAVGLVPFIASPVVLRNLALGGTIMPTELKPLMEINLNWISYYVIYLFPSIWLQEYGVASIPDFRYLFFAFYGIVSLLALAGFAGLMLGKEWETRKKKLVVAALVLPILLNLAGLTYINLFSFATDGRLLFPTIGLAAILFIAGLGYFMKILHQPENRARVLVWFTLFTMLVLDIVVLVNYNRVLPHVIWAVPA